MGYVNLNVDVDVHDVLDELTDEQLLQECEDRKLHLSGPEISSAEDVLQELLCGRIQNAICMLERSISELADPRKEMARIKQGQHPFLTLAH